MKEKCEKLFHILELISAITLVLFFVFSVIILVLWVIFLITQHKAVFIIPIAVFIVFCDVCFVIGYRRFRKSAYYVERSGDTLEFFMVGKTVTKNIYDCIKIGNFAFDRIYFTFKDNEKIRLQKYLKLPQATEWISKKEFPNVK